MSDRRAATLCARHGGVAAAEPARLEATVSCVQEETALRALDRFDPASPLSPERIERHGLDNYRHGTPSLYATFNSMNGEVLDKSAARHTIADFPVFLADVLAHAPRRNDSPVIGDNPSPHKSEGVEASRAERPVYLDYTPTRSARRGRLELSFSKIEHGAFNAVAVLERKRMRDIHQDNDSPQPATWPCRNPTRCIAAGPGVTFR